MMFRAKEMLRLNGPIFKCVMAGCAALTIQGCNKLPEGVLDKDEMVDLLVDIHKGESVVELQRGVYSNDSLRKVLKQSILRKHGVTQAQLDTSFVWYGNHVEDYISIYDDVIVRLEDELKNAQGSSVVTPVFAEGDSTNIWPMSPTFRIADGDVYRNINFEITPDENWKPGDNYQLQLKVINSRQPMPGVKAVVYAEYDNGRVEFRLSSSISNDWLRVRLVTDSTKLPTSVFGTISYVIEPGENIYLDSISLVRTRNRRDTYYERNGQRAFTLPKSE